MTGEMSETYNTSINNPYRIVTNGTKTDYQLSHAKNPNKDMEIPEKYIC